MNVRENTNTVNLKSASIVIILLLREGLTHIQSQIKPQWLFGESFTLKNRFRSEGIEKSEKWQNMNKTRYSAEDCQFWCGFKAKADEESRIRCGAAGTGDWMPHLSVNQEEGQREKPGVDHADQPGHRPRRAGNRPELFLELFIMA